MKLDRYSVGSYSPGANRCKQIAWFFLGQPILQSQILPFSSLKVYLLRLFGASIGVGVRIKPGVKVKFPWRLTIGDYSWIGENAWFDNLAPIVVGDHCCVSQGVYLCTGDHNWNKESFDLITKQIVLEDHSWVAARSSIAPGTIVGQGAVVAMGSTGAGKLEGWTIYRGNPAVPIKERLREEPPNDSFPKS